MSDYNHKLLEHFRNPKNVGIIENADGYGSGKNLVNGYLTELYIKVENGRIEDIKYKTLGCVVTIASASALSESVKGKSLEDIVDGKDSLQRLFELVEVELGGIPERSWHCPPTAIQILFLAILDYCRKNKDEKYVKKIEMALDDIKCYFSKRLGK